MRVGAGCFLKTWTEGRRKGIGLHVTLGGPPLDSCQIFSALSGILHGSKSSATLPLSNTRTSKIPVPPVPISRNLSSLKIAPHRALFPACLFKSQSKTAIHVICAQVVSTAHLLPWVYIPLLTSCPSAVEAREKMHNTKLGDRMLVVEYQARLPTGPSDS